MTTRREALALLLAGGLGGWAVGTRPRTGRRRRSARTPASGRGRSTRPPATCAPARTRTAAGAPKKSPGITGVVLTGLLRTGRVDGKDPMVETGLKYIESLINPQGGTHRRQDPQSSCRTTSPASTSGAGHGQPRQLQSGRRRRGQVSASKLQWDEGEGKDDKDDFYGGAGYDSKSRPDLSNTQFFLDALVAAGMPKDDPAFKKAADLRQPLPEPQRREQRPAVGRQDQRRQLHLQRRGGRRTKAGRARTTAPARLRQHDLRRHQEPDLLRRVQGRCTHQESV